MNFIEGTIKKTAIIFLIALIPLIFKKYILSFLIIVVALFFLQFFRDPDRTVPSEDNIIVAPADGRYSTGKIDKIETVTSDDFLMDELLDDGEKGIIISTFMSPLDVHVNRAPVSGKIVSTKYCEGKFRLAQRPVSTLNEKNLIVIDTKYGKIGVIQVAGFIARRIVQYVQVGDTVNIGDKLGMIKFGSRVELIIPEKNFEIMVDIGSRPIAGETIMATYKK